MSDPSSGKYNILVSTKHNHFLSIYMFTCAVFTIKFKLHVCFPIGSLFIQFSNGKWKGCLSCQYDSLILFRTNDAKEIRKRISFHRMDFICFVEENDQQIGFVHASQWFEWKWNIETSWKCLHNAALAEHLCTIESREKIIWMVILVLISRYIVMGKKNVHATKNTFHLFAINFSEQKKWINHICTSLFHWIVVSPLEF